MMLSCLLRNSEYAERLKSIDGNSTPDEHKSVQVPSITRLQNAIEEAWKQGFDVEVVILIYCIFSKIFVPIH